MHPSGFPGLISTVCRRCANDPTVQVAHSKMEFTRKVPFFKAGHSTVGGTMSVDSKWTAFERLIPSNLNTKKGSVVNSKLYTYLHAAVYRLNHKGEDGFNLIGERVASKLVAAASA